MSGKFRNKYRVESTRAPWWDYAWNGSYFVTICSRNRIPYFGKIENSQMVLSDIGKIANECWYAIPDHFPFVKLGSFIVMPNHVHGIITIDKTYEERKAEPGYLSLVETQNLASLQETNIPSAISPKNKFGPQSRNLASIMRGYKIGVKIRAQKHIADFDWQRRYDDHIIRNDREFWIISKYIINNPFKWNEDEFYL